MLRANLRLTDYDATGRPGADDLDRHTTSLSFVLTKELEGAATATGLTSEEILLAAFGRAIQRTIGAGFISVDIARHKTASYPMALACVGPDRLSATDMLGSVHHSMAALSAQRIVRAVSEDADDHPRSDVLFAYGVPVPQPARSGHFLELHAHVTGPELTLDWWYDARSFEPYTVHELAEQFPYAMIELTSEAAPPILAEPELAAAY
jgi:hypothetical protein